MYPKCTWMRVNNSWECSWYMALWVIDLFKYWWRSQSFHKLEIGMLKVLLLAGYSLFKELSLIQVQVVLWTLPSLKFMSLVLSSLESSLANTCCYLLVLTCFQIPITLWTGAPSDINSWECGSGDGCFCYLVNDFYRLSEHNCCRWWIYCYKIGFG